MYYLYVSGQTLYMNEKFYIYDIGNNMIFIFNKDGSYDKKLSKKGIGPGDYIQIIDFNLIDKDILIMDHSRAIKKYNFNIEFVNEFKFNTYSSQFIIKDENIFLLNESTGLNTDYYISSINTLNNRTQNYIKMPFSSFRNDWVGGVNAFVINNNYVYMSPKFGSIIYCYTNDNYYPKYKIKFNKNNFPENKNIYEFIHDINFPYVVKRNYYMSDKYLIFDYLCDNIRHYGFYDKVNKTLSNGIINNDLIKEFRFFPRWGNDNYLIEEVEAEYVINDFKSLIDINEQLKELKEDDNPVIILYTLKSD